MIECPAVRARAVVPTTKETSAILIWLDGGPGHMDLYDMKPEAPAEFRGIWRPIRTNVPGIEITTPEELPDDSTPELEEMKGKAGLGGRGEIQTFFDFHDADEGRL